MEVYIVSALNKPIAYKRLKLPIQVIVPSSTIERGVFPAIDEAVIGLAFLGSAGLTGTLAGLEEEGQLLQEGRGGVLIPSLNIEGKRTDLTYSES